MEYNRRAEDKPAVVERVVALETNVGHIKEAINTLGDDLREHITVESEVIKDLAVSMQKVVGAVESNANTMERMAGTVQTMADHSSRVSALERWRENAEPALEKANRLWWAIGLAAFLAPGFWALATKFGWF